MLRLVGILALLVLSACTTTRKVTILHFSDYHSHAVPFYVDGEGESAGIARAFGYVKPLSEREDVLVFNGGDTMNRGAPAWSDKYGCIEWAWWNGVVDAMAYGNHDADYGTETFSRCVDSIEYPILGANVVAGDGQPVFLHGGKPYAVFDRGGVRVGVFALAGRDFETLVGESSSPASEVRFRDRATVGREVVEALRNEERVDAVVLIGHASTEDDESLAREVAGIDLILGTHSHRLESPRRIDGTDTWILSPGQYLTHVSRAELTVGRSGLTIAGDLVAMASERIEDESMAARVAGLQRELELDPSYAELFRVIGSLDEPLSNAGVNERNTPLGSFVMTAILDDAHTDGAASTSSSFRGSLPSGVIRETDLRDVLPYDNRLLRYELSGDALSALLELIASRRGTDSFCQTAGELDAIDSTRSYSVAVTDYMAKVSADYRQFFSRLEPVDVGITVRESVRRALAGSPAKDR